MCTPISYHGSWLISLRFEHHTASLRLPLSRVEALLSCEFVSHKRIVSHDETTVISPVAMCSAQARYEGAREHRKERNPISSTPGCVNVYEMQQARRCIPRWATLTCPTAHNPQVQVNTPIGLLDHIRLYAVRERTLVSSSVLAWVPDILFLGRKQSPDMAIYL